MAGGSISVLGYPELRRWSRTSAPRTGIRNASSKNNRVVHDRAGRSDDLGRGAAVGTDCRIGTQDRVAAGAIWPPEGKLSPYVLLSSVTFGAIRPLLVL